MSVIRPTVHRGGYDALIGYLQRTELDEQALKIAPGEIQTALSTALGLNTRLPVWLAEVEGISRFWLVNELQEPGRGYLTCDILAGLSSLLIHDEHVPIYFLIRGESKRIRLYIGTDSQESGAIVRAAFSSYYPGIKLYPEKELSDVSQDDQEQVTGQWHHVGKELQQELRPFIHDCRYVGVVTGVPTPNVGEKSGPVTQIDRLLRGLYGTEWALLVLANPIEDPDVVEMQLAFLREQLRVEQEEQFRERRESAGQSVAIYYNQLLQMQHQLLEACLYEGGWWVQSYISSPNETTYQRAKGLIKSIFSGGFSRADRIRVLDCFGAGPKAASFSPIAVERSPAPAFELSSNRTKSFKYCTLLSSNQLSALIHLPRIEMPGYYVQESATFDVSSHVPKTDGKGNEIRSIVVGEILDRGRSTGNFYRVPITELTKHCLLVGITGSGKTTTSKYLFQQLQRQEPPIPILVIEPAKREYRELAGLLPPEKVLRVFTVGEEHQEAAPFRLNPFEIRPGVSVQTHIDLLKSVFNASFGTFAPLPQVLERAIHEIYRDKGWDTVYSSNKRDLKDQRTKWHPLAQPTLTDLYHKVGELVPKLGYDKEVERNVRTALETRINSLRIGAKGLMLDTRQSIPIEYLLAEPTVLELEGVGDDDEKAFLMGLILMALYEYYRVKGQPAGPGLSHVTVVEEAHRLLANVPVNMDPEAGNLRGKAVETFVNMLSEVRAYGEGFIIAEQIPTKLAPDIIKNTGLKIMHRTVASDDREVMGGAMNLAASQLRQVVALGTGETVVHGGGKYGDDNAILVKIPPVKGDNKSTPINVRSIWRRFIEHYKLTEIFLPYPTCSSFCNTREQERPDHLCRVCMDARRIAEAPVVQETFASFVLSLVAGGLSRDENELVELLSKLYPRVIEAIHSHITGSSKEPAQISCVLTHALYAYMQKRGAQYGWDYTDVMQMTKQLLPAVRPVSPGQALNGDTRRTLRDFCQQYKERCCLKFKPFYGCDRVCRQPLYCLYRYSVEPALRDEVLDDSFCDITRDDLQSTIEACEEAAERILMLPDGGEPGRKREDIEIIRKVAVCYLIQKTHSIPGNWPVKNRQEAIEQLLTYYGLLKAN